MNENQQKAFDSWAKFLNPEVLKSNLIAASLFLAAFEALRSSVISPIRDFYSCGFDQYGPIVDPEYQTKVLSLDKSPLRASLLWLKDREVISSGDMLLVDRIRKHRNQLAHELMKYVATSDCEIDGELIVSIYELVAKIDRWWILNVEVPTNPDFDGYDVYESGVQSGNMIFLKLMIDIVTGHESANEVYASFMGSVREMGYNPKNRG
jgi:hypothetical protein